MAKNRVYEIEALSCLEEISEKYKSQTGAPPFALSHWDPSKHTMDLLLPDLKLPASPSPMPYIYTYENSKQKVLEQLGFRQSDKYCSYVQAGTNASFLVACWLTGLNVSQVLVICPAYFSIFYGLEILHLPCKRLYMQRDTGNWYLPHEKLVSAINRAPLQTAIWITNPVYCTGNYLSDLDTEFLNLLLHSGVTVVADECLCPNGREIGRKLAWSDKFVGIYSPHKTVSVNAIKFAAVISDKKHELFFDRWADVLVGGLTASNFTAIAHFIGDNFSQFLSVFTERINSVRNHVVEAINCLSDGVETDKDTEGLFITCYIPKIAGIKGKDSRFLYHLTLETGTLVIPGVINHFPEDVGFCFRINLARAGPQFFSSLQRTLEYLARISR